jgi:hypothetical protein
MLVASGLLAAAVAAAMTASISDIGTRHGEHQPGHQGQAENLTCHLLFSSAWLDIETRT